MIRALQPSSLIDFPGKISAVIFTGGCNYRCPFCHNSNLVIPERYPAEIPEQRLFDLLDARAGLLDGVTITGGEPTLHSGLPALIKQIKKRDMAVKLDTNGSNPDRLCELLENQLLDFIAVDIKTLPEHYPQATGGHSFTAVQQTLNLLSRFDIPVQLRTTYVSRLHTPEMIKQLAETVPAEFRYTLQNYRRPDEPLEPGWYAPETGAVQFEKLQQEIARIRTPF